jgi:hypothetical protein
MRNTPVVVDISISPHGVSESAFFRIGTKAGTSKSLRTVRPLAKPMRALRGDLKCDLLHVATITQRMRTGFKLFVNSWLIHFVTVT